MSFRSYHSSPPNFRALAQRFCLGAGERPLNKQTNKNKPPANLFPQEFILFATVKFKLKNSSQKQGRLWYRELRGDLLADLMKIKPRLRAGQVRENQGNKTSRRPLEVRNSQTLTSEIRLDQFVMPPPGIYTPGHYCKQQSNRPAISGV